MHPSCSIFRVEGNRTLSELAEEIQGHRSEREVETLDETLLTTVDDVSQIENGVKFVLSFDFPGELNVRGQEEPQYYAAYGKVTVVYADDVFSDGLFVFGGSDYRKLSIPRISDVIEDLYADDIDQLTIPPQVIAEVTRDDSEESVYKIWKDIDEFTDGAAIQGAVEQSTYSHEFDERGLPVWVQFISRSRGRLIGLSTKSLVFYGSDDDPLEGEMVDYFRSTIRPKLSI